MKRRKDPLFFQHTATTARSGPHHLAVKIPPKRATMFLWDESVGAIWGGGTHRRLGIYRMSRISRLECVLISYTEKWFH